MTPCRTKSRQVWNVGYSTKQPACLFKKLMSLFKKEEEEERLLVLDPVGIDMLFPLPPTKYGEKPGHYIYIKQKKALKEGEKGRLRTPVT